MIVEIIRCFHCGEAILPSERSATVPSVFHVECWVRIGVGSLGHLQQRCACFGGTEEDPPGMTTREAAWAAWDYNRMLWTRAN